MSAVALLESLAAVGVMVEARGDRLQVDAPAGVLTPEVLAQLKEHKPALLALLAPDTKQLKAARKLVAELRALGVTVALRNGYATIINSNDNGLSDHHREQAKRLGPEILIELQQEAG